jgi:hypothetical protein
VRPSISIPTIEALKARIDAIIDAATKIGALDEDALAELSAGIAEQLLCRVGCGAGRDSEISGG